VAVEVDIDVVVLKDEIKKTYASVSDEPERDYIFPTGRTWAEDLDYPKELGNVPDSAVESFAGSPIPGRSVGWRRASESSTSVPARAQTRSSLHRWSGRPAM
jgi:hypothetical protein